MHGEEREMADECKTNTDWIAGYEWVKLLKEHPEEADKCVWARLGGLAPSSFSVRETPGGEEHVRHLPRHDDALDGGDDESVWRQRGRLPRGCLRMLTPCVRGGDLA